jgi:hypothetical protein
MKHPSVRELFDYWNDRRGERLAPERADIEPAAIRRVLADTFILSREPRHPFRIAGTRVCALFGRELKGSAFLDLWSAPSRSELNTLLTIVADETVGVVASAVAAGPAAAPLHLELIVLPLLQRGPAGARLLGALAPSQPPPWLGRHGLRGLTLGPHRYVGPAVIGSVGAAVPPRPIGRLKHGFVVYDGGQA